MTDKKLDYGKSLIRFMRKLYEVERAHALTEGRDFFGTIDLPRDVEWDTFRAHYDNDDVKAFNNFWSDYLAFPPAAEALREASLRQTTLEKSFSELFDMIDECKRDVMEHGRPEDALALKQLFEMRDEVLQSGKITEH